MKKSNIPRHVAIIMDGNRRWAKQKGLSVFNGHKIGEDRLEPVVDCAIELGIRHLTFWAFSTENWYRSKKEVQFLLSLYRKKLNDKIDSFHKKNVKINVIGNIKMFPSDLQKKTAEWIKRTENNKKITVNFALSYGGRDEVMRAIEKVRANSKFQMTNDKLKISDFEKYLDTAGQPDPDLLIRTGGEKRLSGFLLWQLEYTELYFTQTLWPDFTKKDFDKAIKDYQKRKRRYGK